MPTYNNLIRQFADKCERFFVQSKSHDQNYPWWDDQKKDPAACCAGAKFARALGIFDKRTNRETAYYFEDGIRAACDMLAVSERQLECMLWASGASHAPFSGYEWPCPIAEVFYRFVLIEQKPNHSQLARFSNNRIHRINENKNKIAVYMELACPPTQPTP